MSPGATLALVAAAALLGGTIGYGQGRSSGLAEAPELAALKAEDLRLRQEEAAARDAAWARYQSVSAEAMTVCQGPIEDVLERYAEDWVIDQRRTEDELRYGGRNEGIEDAFIP